MITDPVQLIYIHGFQGNDTTFRSFPTDLHKFLTTSGFPVKTSLYPTYKSVKPIENACREFIEWLTRQSPGPIILAAHSLGGLLAADAANIFLSGAYNGRHRVIGILAFDCPYLGIHPHVVISGIQSLLDDSDDEDENGQLKPSKLTDKDLNDESQVEVVDSRVTDDWEGWKRGHRESEPSAAAPGTPKPPPPPSPQHLSRSSSSVPSSTSLSRPKSPLLHQTLSFLNSSSAPSFLAAPTKFIQTHADDPLVKWVTNNPNNPLSAAKEFVVEHFQFGSCVFDPSGLKERYQRLVAGKVPWVNYWTQTVPTEIFRRTREREGILSAAIIMPPESPFQEEASLVDNDLALLQTGFSHSPTSPTPSTASTVISSVQTTTISLPESTKARDGKETKEEEKARKAAEKVQKAARKVREKEEKRLRKEEVKQGKRDPDAIKAKQKELPTARHFTTHPTGLASVLGGWENWEKVEIAGVDDEVAAHCGLFIVEQNYDYNGLVLRVAGTVQGWCERA